MIMMSIAALLLVTALPTNAMENFLINKANLIIATYNIGKLRRDSTVLHQYYDFEDDYYQLFQEIEEAIAQCCEIKNEVNKMKTASSVELYCKRVRSKSDNKKKKRKINLVQQEIDDSFIIAEKNCLPAKEKLNQEQQKLVMANAKKIDLIKKFEFVRQKNYEKVIDKILAHQPTVFFLQEMDCPITADNKNNFGLGKIFIERLQMSGYELLSSRPRQNSDVVTAIKNNDWLFISSLSIDGDKILAVMLQHKLSKGYFAFFNVHLPGHDLQHINYSYPPIEFPSFPPTQEKYQKIIDGFHDHEKNIKATAAKNVTEKSAEKLFSAMRALSAIGYTVIAGGDFNVDPTKNMNVLSWPSNYERKLPKSPTNIFIPFANEIDRTKDLRTLDFFLCPRDMYANIFGLYDIPIIEPGLETTILPDSVLKFPSDHVPVIGYFDMMEQCKNDQQNCLMQ